jgi:hypothetical protein
MILFCFVFVFAVLGMKLRAFHMLGNAISLCYNPAYKKYFFFFFFFSVAQAGLKLMTLCLILFASLITSVRRHGQLA